MFLKHELTVLDADGYANIISVTNANEDEVCIRISGHDFPNCDTAYILLKKEQLHEFIGVLLHCQSKMKGGKK